MYVTSPSEPARHALDLFARERCHDVLELGAGQCRDTLAFLRAGFAVTACEYAPVALAELTRTATDAGLADRLTAVVHDTRLPCPFLDESIDGVESHMLFNMALTTAELASIAGRCTASCAPAGGTCTPRATSGTPTTAPGSRGATT